MSNLVFMLPFLVEMSEFRADELRHRLELFMTRVDDWDLQMGFSLVGGTGAIRLFKRTTEGNEANLAHALFGTAVTPEDRSKVAELYPACLNALRAIDARIDNERLIDPQMAGQSQHEVEF